MTKIGLINYGSGNFASVYNALKYLEVNVIPIDEPKLLDGVDRVMLPGVGAFTDTMHRLENLGFIDALKEHVQIQKKPFLGICVGLQVLADIGEEFGECKGLGYVPGRVLQLPPNMVPRLPHIGWNAVHYEREDILFRDIPSGSDFYFVHSYYFNASNAEYVVAKTNYGIEFPCVIRASNVVGVQFHPEKSQAVGLRMLKNFSYLDCPL